ncbi:DUF4942 domain-containing protein [Escherichia coli]|nr:DUF4942 domain-containing protein [Escherichia coli]
MPLLNDLLDFSDHPLMPPPSAQLFAEHLPVEWIQHCLTLSAHATVRRRRLADLERMLMLLDGKPVPYNRADVTRRLSDHIHENRHSNRYEDEMFVIKYFQKGTAHIVFKRPELIDKLNNIIARHYPGALPAR